MTSRGRTIHVLEKKSGEVPVLIVPLGKLGKVFSPLTRLRLTSHQGMDLVTAA